MPPAAGSDRHEGDGPAARSTDIRLPRLSAQDVERWLADEPVLARREPLQRAGTALDAPAPNGRGRGRRRPGRGDGRPRRRPVRPDPGQSRSSGRRTSTWPSRFEIPRRPTARSRPPTTASALASIWRSRRSRRFMARSARICCSGKSSLTACVPRCSTSATSFYKRLEDLLKEQADQRSRASLGQAYHDIGELTAKIGSQGRCAGGAQAGPGTAARSGRRAGGE